MMNDIKSRDDIELFVNEFYTYLLEDKNLRHFFDDIIKKDQLLHHLKIISDFWEDILLDSNNYNRNAMKPHMFLNESKPFTKKHFDIWLGHFNFVINRNFKGEKVEFAKTRALSIATIMQIKMKKAKPL